MTWITLCPTVINTKDGLWAECCKCLERLWLWYRDQVLLSWWSVQTASSGGPQKASLPHWNMASTPQKLSPSVFQIRPSPTEEVSLKSVQNADLAFQNSFNMSEVDLRLPWNQMASLVLQLSQISLSHKLRLSPRLKDVPQSYGVSHIAKSHMLGQALILWVKSKHSLKSPTSPALWFLDRTSFYQFCPSLQPKQTQ